MTVSFFFSLTKEIPPVESEKAVEEIYDLLRNLPKYKAEILKEAIDGMSLASHDFLVFLFGCVCLYRLLFLSVCWQQDMAISIFQTKSIGYLLSMLNSKQPANNLQII